jgi:hypothetical protein
MVTVLPEIAPVNVVLLLGLRETDEYGAASETYEFELL